MKTIAFSIRVEEGLLAEIEMESTKNRRSRNKEILVLLEEALKQRGKLNNESRK